VLIFIDEIDTFARDANHHKLFKQFVKALIDTQSHPQRPQSLTLKRASAKNLTKRCSVSVLGIANSVELFRGEINNKGTLTGKVDQEEIGE
jgi:hypothetical protein